MMRRRHSFLFALLVAGGSLVARDAAAIVYDLKTGTKTLTMPDGQNVVMWGFGLASDPDVSIPGPRLTVPPGDTTLTINLTNSLAVPVSIVIPSLPAPLTPVWDDGSTGPRTNGQQRVVSFTQVAAPNGGTASFTWTGVGPGTYLYHSGTRPAVQVQMGLYGAVTRDAATGNAYPDTPYEAEVLLLLSEIDPALHTAVANGSYGSAAYPSPNAYRAKYFLVNGQAASSPPSFSATVNQRVLVRLLNAGLDSVVPTSDGWYFGLLGEDGRAAPFRVQRYGGLLAAGKTRDLLLEASDAGTLTLFDRSLRIASGALGAAGVIARIAVTAAAGAPVAVDDGYTVQENGALDTVAAGLTGILGNDSGSGLLAVLVAAPSGGTLALQPDGSFSYQPKPGWSGADFFTYRAMSGTLASNVATVAITVTPVPDAPVAAPDTFASTSTTLTVPAPGVLANDTDLDGDMLEAVLVSGPATGTLTLNPDGSFSFTGSPGSSTVSFTYRATDGTLLSAPTTVTINLNAQNSPPTAVDDDAQTTVNTPVTINLTANDLDSDGTINPSTVVIVSTPTQRGVLSGLANGSLTYTPRKNFGGTDTFTYRVRDNLGAISAPATVRVQVVK